MDREQPSGSPEGSLEDGIDRVCARCRRGLGAGERCPRAEPPRALSLVEPTERAALRDLAWQTVPKSRWLGTNWRLVLAFGGATLTGLLAGGLALFYTDPGAAPWVAMAGGLGGLVIVGALATRLPLPARFYHRAAAGADGVCGDASTTGAVTGALSPGPGASDGPLVAGLAIVAGEPRASTDSHVTLHRARARALVIELDDGRRVHVPGGPIELTGAPGTFEAIDDDGARALVEAIGGAPWAEQGEGDEGPVPATAARRWSLAAGARVELRSPTRVSPRDAHGGAFRTAANRDLAPVGVVRLHAIP